MASKELLISFEHESELSESARARKKKYQDLERTKGVDPSAVDKALREYIEIGDRLSALRQRIIRQQTGAIGPTDYSTEERREERELEEAHCSVAEEKLLLLTELVTDLQDDMLGEEAQYEAILKTQPVKKSALRQARTSYLESVEQLWAFNEQLVNAQAERARCNMRDIRGSHQ